MPRTALQTREILDLVRSERATDRKKGMARIRAALEAAEGQTYVAAEALGISQSSLNRVYLAFPELREYAAELRLRHGVPGQRVGVAVDPNEVRARLAQGSPVRRPELLALAGVSPAAVSRLVSRGTLVETVEGVTADSAIRWLERRGQWPRSSGGDAE